VQVLANVGITDAAEKLSKILGRRVDLSIPDVSVLAIETIPQFFGDIDSVYLGVYMPIVGQINGTILFSLHQESGYELVDMLLGLPQGTTTSLSEDGESVLKEVTNIVGSAVVNAFADKIEMAIKPTVPSVVHDYMQSILDSILAFHTAENEYALVMDTEFFHQDDRVIGKLMIMPTTSSLSTIVERLRN
ncbi:MAG TPA: chemotaxis protein CheC, partial [Spirochaetota bacterium]|nr:chemotaxis protein CheC [Spirochaetota bacterium]